MVQDQLSTLEKQLGQIAEMLLLNGTIAACPGLVRGKMGIAVFFFHYAQYAGNDLFADYAIDLIGEVQQQIHANSPADYEKGIAGIGVGIDYLIRNRLLVAADDICEDLDDRMCRAVMYDPWQDFSLYDGLTGYGRYWMTRLRYKGSSAQARECILRIAGLIEAKWPDIPVEEQIDVYCFFTDLQHLQEMSGFERWQRLWEQCREEWDLQLDSSRFSRLGNSFMGNILRMYQLSQYFNAPLQHEIDIALKQIPDLDMDKPHVAMGLLAGFAGEGMLRLAALNQSNRSWMKLF